jgi:hypothetical protein
MRRCPVIEPNPPTLDLLPSFAPCPTCNRLVLVRIYALGRGKSAAPYWQACDPPHEPVTGAPHVCPGEVPS